MARIRPIYSESHDRSLFPQQPKKGRKKAAATPPPPPTRPVPNTGIGFLPANLSEAQRRELRARQLVAEKNVRPLPLGQIEEGGEVNHPPLLDHDIQFDPDLRGITSPRGEQYNMVDGETVFPNVSGPRMDRTDMRTLSEEEVYPNLPTFEPSRANASKELIAAVSAEDQTILAFDNELTTVHTAIRRLRQKAERIR